MVESLDRVGQCHVAFTKKRSFSLSAGDSM
jgi:hypothetical protein